MGLRAITLGAKRGWNDVGSGVKKWGACFVHVIPRGGEHQGFILTQRITSDAAS